MLNNIVTAPQRADIRSLFKMKMITASPSCGVADEQAANAKLPHVLLVLDQLPKALGGGERIVLKIAELLPLYGFRVSILTFSIHPESSAIASAPCPVYLLPLKRTYDFAALRACFQLGRFLRQEKIQIVQTFFESSDIWAGFVTKVMSRARLVWSRRDMGILRTSKHRIAYRLMSGLPDAVFAVSEQVRRHCIDVDGINPARVLTIYNGLNLSEWEEVTRSSKAPAEIWVTTVGNIRRVKGHDVLIRAAGLLVPRFPQVRFDIAGDVLEPAYFAELQALLLELNLSGHFHFRGGVRDLQKHLSAADIFVLPSRSEGFSNAIVEAMASSLPVVATAVGGNAEAVQDGLTGLVVPPDDVEALAEAISRLLSDSALARQMGEAGKAAVSKKFTLEAMMKRMTAAYGELLRT